MEDSQDYYDIQESQIFSPHWSCCVKCVYYTSVNPFAMITCLCCPCCAFAICRTPRTLEITKEGVTLTSNWSEHHLPAGDWESMEIVDSKCPCWCYGCGCCGAPAGAMTASGLSAFFRSREGSTRRSFWFTAADPQGLARFVGSRTSVPIIYAAGVQQSEQIKAAIAKALRRQNLLLPTVVLDLVLQYMDDYCQEKIRSAPYREPSGRMCAIL